MKAFAITAAFAASLIGGAASAHTELKTASPAPNAVVKTAPTTLRLDFTSAVVPRFTTISVTGPNGKALHAGPVTVDAKNKGVVTAPLHGAGAPGAYKIDWSAASSDMHKMTGSYTFTVRP
jgi:copper resistance protein C